MQGYLEFVSAALAASCLLLIYKNKKSLRLIKTLMMESAHLKEANQYKRDALSNISHEIRTPISAILGAQEKILREQRLPEQDRKILSSAHASAKSMLEILNQVLDLSKIEAGKLELDECACDLKNLLKQIERTFLTITKQSGNRLQFEICSDIADSLIIDGTRLGQIIHNLLSNAIKHTRNGEILISTRVIANDHFGQLIYFECADTGSGISDSEIKRMLQPYEQNLKNITQFSEMGAGLGLAITEHLLHLMNSRLDIESEVNLGSSFSFTLALRRSIDQPRYSEEKLATHKPMSPAEQNKTVMIVDDHTPSRLITESQLKEMGYCVHSCRSAEEAIELIENHQFDMVVTDFSMPGMSGEDLAKQIRSSQHGATIRIYGITARTEGAKELLQLDNPFDNILIKPASLADWHREIYLKDTYLEHLLKLAGDEPNVCSIIAEEILYHQKHVFSILRESYELGGANIDEKQIKQMAHKLLGGAKLSNDLTLIKLCERVQKSSVKIQTNLLIELCIALTKSNRILNELVRENKVK
jgi:two-component system sensor histidine kinase EvgS